MRQLAAALAVSRRPVPGLPHEASLDRELEAQARSVRRAYVRRERSRRASRRRAALARLSLGIVPSAPHAGRH
jgi:hypothetical protein